jgi:hypothetical protein
VYTVRFACVKHTVSNSFVCADIATPHMLSNLFRKALAIINGGAAAAAAAAASVHQAGATPFATSFTGSGSGISPSSSLVQPVPLGQQQTAADATAEARELLLQRQLSSPVMPADMGTLQQMYSQQLQQLQMMQTQLLGNLPPEVQQHQQQQMMQLQQQLLAQMTRAQSGGSQHDATQQAGMSGAAGDVTRSGSSGSAGLQLPRQPRHTAADLFRPDSSSYTHTGLPSSSGTSLHHLLETDRLLDEDSDVPSVPFSFDVGRLQAIIAKVYPDSSGLSSASIAALQVQQQQQQQQQQRREVGATAAEQCRAAAPAGASPATYKQQQQHGVSVPPNSIGAFGAAAALAAAAAAGISFDANAGANNSISSMYGGFGGAAGSAAAAAALNSTHHGSDQLGQAAPPAAANTSRSAATAPNAAQYTSTASGGVSGGAGDLTTQLTTVHSAGACSSASSKLDRTSQQLLESSPSSTSAQSAPPMLVGSPQCEQLTGQESQPLPAALSAPAAGTLQSVMDQQQQQHQQQQQMQQVLLPPDMAAVVAEELNRMRLAAPVLAQLLGLGSISQQQQQQQQQQSGTAAAAAAAAAASMPDAAAPIDTSRVGELERQLAALQREKTYLSTVLQVSQQTLICSANCGCTAHSFQAVACVVPC